ncbi:MAG: acetylornithine deacetylase [Bacteroidetes bacterium HGW-Bacteroidetes-4]|jgi:acetylornithine deacetylase|nr:MAG: acetylornithine deacetylase [Bacteroidetes bacterium HGW-Bacteroidetes-4]
MKIQSLKEAHLLAVETLKQLIQTQSFSTEEAMASEIIVEVLSRYGYQPHRKGNNVFACSNDFQAGRSTLMLNSHLDTVKPSKGWNTNPLEPVLHDGKLIGLGSNDAGASLVSLLAVFIWSEQFQLSYNRVFVASAEEEISGAGGIEWVIPVLGKIDAGIVGEPTQMQMAVAEKGLMVLDCTVHGQAGHAARNQGVNAIKLAIKEIEWFHSFKFSESSSLLGGVKMTVTQIQAGTQHNVIPDTCEFVVDVRTNEKYSNQQVLNTIKEQVACDVKARSLRMNSSAIDRNHPLVRAAEKLGIVCFGSPTTSDQAVIQTFPTVKMGPGDSTRSHTANEFIYLHEIESGIGIYAELMQALKV